MQNATKYKQKLHINISYIMQVCVRNVTLQRGLEWLQWELYIL